MPKHFQTKDETINDNKNKKVNKANTNNTNHSANNNQWLINNSLLKHNENAMRPKSGGKVNNYYDDDSLGSLHGLT